MGEDTTTRSWCRETRLYYIVWMDTLLLVQAAAQSAILSCVFACLSSSLFPGSRSTVRERNVVVCSRLPPVFYWSGSMCLCMMGARVYISAPLMVMMFLFESRCFIDSWYAFLGKFFVCFGPIWKWKIAQLLLLSLYSVDLLINVKHTVH